MAGEIEALLLENVAAADAMARFCAVQWATKLYPFKHAASRYICMLGAGDHKLEVRWGPGWAQGESLVAKTLGLS